MVTLEELAKQESYDIRILEKLLNCLVCIGLLEKFRPESDQKGKLSLKNTYCLNTIFQKLHFSKSHFSERSREKI